MPMGPSMWVNWQDAIFLQISIAGTRDFWEGIFSTSAGPTNTVCPSPCVLNRKGLPPG